MTMRQGSHNQRSDDYSTVAFWYQSEPHAPFPKLPPAEARYPSVKDSPPDAVSGVPQSQIEK